MSLLSHSASFKEKMSCHWKSHAHVLLMTGESISLRVFGLEGLYGGCFSGHLRNNGLAKEPHQMQSWLGGW
jgi:hypothetical protein